MASTSSAELGSAVPQPRNRHLYPAWQQPSPPPGSFYAMNGSCPTLHPGLEGVAQCLFSLDIKLIKKAKIIQVREYDKVKTEDRARAAELSCRIEQLKELEYEGRNRSDLTLSFADTYLTDKQFAPIWRRYLNFLKTILSSKKKVSAEVQRREQTRATLLNYESLAHKLRHALVEAAKVGLLKYDILSAIRGRWIRLHDVVEFCRSKSDVAHLYTEPDPRPIPTWETVMEAINIAAPTKILFEPPVEEKPDRLHFDTLFHNDAHKVRSARAYWSTIFFLLMALTSVAMFGLGYARSTHQRGTTVDADFWFFTQASVAQLSGLASSAMLEWSNNKIPRRRWAVLCGIAAAASLLAVPVYLLLASEWAVFLALAATMSQSVLILQRFV